MRALELAIHLQARNPKAIMRWPRNIIRLSEFIKVTIVRLTARRQFDWEFTSTPEESSWIAASWVFLILFAPGFGGGSLT